MSALLTSREAAAYLRVNRHQFEEWVRKGFIAVVRLPGMKRWRFTIEALDALIESATDRPNFGPIESASLNQNWPELARIDRQKEQRREKTSTYEVGWHERLRTGAR